MVRQLKSVAMHADFLRRNLIAQCDAKYSCQEAGAAYKLLLPVDHGTALLLQAVALGCLLAMCRLHRTAALLAMRSHASSGALRSLNPRAASALRDRQHMKVLQNATCLDSLRSIFVCLYSLMCSEAVYASSLMGLLGPKTDFKVHDDVTVWAKPACMSHSLQRAD